MFIKYSRDFLPHLKIVIASLNTKYTNNIGETTAALCETEGKLHNAGRLAICSCQPIFVQNIIL